MPTDAFKNALVHALATVRDPATGKDLIALGLVEEIEIDGGKVRVASALGGAPEDWRRRIEDEVRAAFLQVQGVEGAEGIEGVEGASVAFVRAGASRAHATPPSPPAGGGGAGTESPAAAAAPKRLPMAGGGPGGGGGGAHAHGQGQGQSHGQGMAGREPIRGVTHLIAVASGKGGVGKST